MYGYGGYGQVKVHYSKALEDKLSRLSSSTTPPPSVSPAELSDVSTRLASKAEQALFKPEGIMAALTSHVKLMEDRKKASAVARGNQVFKDQQAVQAFVIASGDTAATGEGRGGSLDLTNGWRWTHSWSSLAKFEGSFNNGGFDIMLYVQ